MNNYIQTRALLASIDVDYVIATLETMYLSIQSDYVKHSIKQKIEQWDEDFRIIIDYASRNNLQHSSIFRYPSMLDNTLNYMSEH